MMRSWNASQWQRGFILIVTIYIVFPLFAIAGQHNCTGEPCMYGICMNGANSSYSCYCIDGYTGINCEINWDDCWSNPCLNGGTCNDAVAYYNCTCPDGFIGLNCEQKYSECMNHPCLNNGTCIDYNGFMCQCPEGYSGDYCEIDVAVCNNTICKNGGECVEGPGYSFSCKCQAGWTGLICDDDIDECLVSPCENGGLCLNVPATYTCACLFGFTGKDCDKAIVPCEENPCKNEAMCLLEDSQMICYCVPDYHGQFCELRYDDCESKFARCNNGGTCIDGINNYTCSCPYEYSGASCNELTGKTTTEVTSRVATDSRTFPLPTIVYSTSPSTVSTRTGSSSGYHNFSEKPTIFTTTIGPRSTHSSETPEGREIPSSQPNFTSTTLKTNLKDFSSSTSPGAKSLDETESHEEATTPLPFEVTDSTVRTTDFKDFTGNSFTTEEISTVEEISTTYSQDTSEPRIPTDWSSVSSTTAPKNVTTLVGRITTPEIDYTSRVTLDGRENETRTSSTKEIFPGIDFTISEYFTTTPNPSIIFQSRGFTEDEFDSTVSDFSSVPSVESTSDTFVKSDDEGVKQDPQMNSTTANCNQTSCDKNGNKCNCDSSEQCKNGPSIENAAFNGKSYVRQHVDIDVDRTLRIFIRLKTKSKNGVLVHAFFDDERYVLLYMEVGQLKFQFSCGLQTMLLGEIDSPINNGFDVDVEMRFKYDIGIDELGKCSARLLVNNTMAMSGEQILSSEENVPRQVRVHLGGIPQAFSHYFPRIAMGFVGCMNILRINNASRHFIHDSIETYQIEECKSFLCLLNPCRNFGSCHDIDGRVHCKCVAGYSGDVCERSACDDNPCYLGATCISSPGTGFICVCPLGMHGLLCEEEFAVIQPSFTVFIPGFSSYAAYGLTYAIKDAMELRMRLVPHSLDQISLLVFIGQSGASRDVSDHFSITYVRGYIMLTWDLGSGVRRIFTKTPLRTRTHRPHTLRVGRRGREAWLSVDGLGNVTGLAAGTMSQLDVAPILYVGGHKSRNFDALPHDLPLHTGFYGCIFDIELKIDDSVYPITKMSPATGRGVGECHRNECSQNSCKNGALCLNHGPTYSCVCMKEWEGADCSTPAITCSLSTPNKCNKTDVTL